MPYQENYAEDITNLTSGDRVVEKAIFRFAVPTDEIIAEVIGDNEIGLDDRREFLELHFYDRNTNKLVYSVAVPFTDDFLYVRDSVERLDKEIAAGNNKSIQLGLEFWNPEDVGASLFGRYLSTVPAGTYNVLINFFSNELGTYNDKNWRISQINSTATELILEPIDPNKVPDDHLGQFADKSIFITHFRPFMEYMFETYKDDDEHYEQIIDKFFRLIETADPAAHRIIQQNNLEYRTELKNTLKDILKGVYGDYLCLPRDGGDGTMVPNFVERERKAKRFRITNQTFNTFLRESVGVHLRRFKGNFPDSDDRITYADEVSGT